MRLNKSAFRRAARRSRGGFTLLEITLVVGIIGALVAGIFSAASLAQYRAEINRASDQFNQLPGNMRGMFAGQNATYTALSAAGSPYNGHVTSPPIAAAELNFYTPLFVTAGVFPSDMRSGNIVNNPWNLGSGTSTVMAGLVGTTGQPMQFVIRYSALPPEACADMLVRNSLPGRETGLNQIYVNSALTGDATAGTLPLAPVRAASACNQTGKANIIDWYYYLAN